MTAVDIYISVIFALIWATAGLAALTMKKFGFFSEFASLRLPALLFATTATSAFIIAFTIDDLILQPRELQRQLLGNEWVSPKSLVGRAWFPTIMDPWSTWTYHLTPAELSLFKARCGKGELVSLPKGCEISRLGENDFTIFAIEGDRLIITDGLH